MTFKMKNMEYWKSKNSLPGINNKSEGTTDLPDGRSASSPLQAEIPKKTYSTKEDDPSYQVPVQPGENPDVAITGGSLTENINDLEDRIGFLNEKYSEYDRPLTDKEKKSMKVLKDRLKIERAKRK